MPYTYNAQDVFDFANANGFQYRQKGNEITFKLCPYCNGGNTPDKETFSINRDTGAYKCLRNSCSRQGHFVQLARDFGYKLDMGEQKVYRSLPQTKPEDRVIRDTAISYLESRGISKEICRKYFITAQSNKPDVIVFPFYDENNVLQLVKYRNSKFVKGKNKSKEWCENDCKPILFGMYQCDMSVKTAVITEGQLDSLTLAECGIKNALSVPMGCNNFKWIEHCRGWLTDNFDKLIVFGDYENGKMTLIDRIREELPMRKGVYAVRSEDYLGEKDANDIFRKYGKGAVIEAVESAKAATEEVLPGYPFVDDVTINKRTNKKQYHINTALLADYVRSNCYYIFARDSAKGAILRYWYDFGSGVYKLVSDNEIKGYIDQIIKSVSPLIVNSSYSREAFELISHDDNYIPIEKAKADENIINFENGLLYLDTLELKPHTPLVFTTIQIPCKWEPDAPKAEVFSKYMYDLTNGRADVEKFLLEYIGLVISNISSKHFKKALIMYGAGDTGKSQLKKLTEMLIGNENAISIDLEALEKRFGTSAIYGKRLAGSADMSFVEVNELKVFKSLTGGDNIFIEYKREGAFNGSYDGFLWFCTNELPRFGGDKGDHVYNRMALIECNNVIPPEKQDHNLLSEMYSERESIVYMSVMAAREVVANGYKLDIPETVFKNIEEYKVSNSSIAQFFYECCEINDRPPKYGCETSVFVKTFRNWYMANVGRNPPSTQILNKELMKLADYDKSELIKKYDGNRFYQFILTEAAQGYMTE
ncbi:MAG: phage/plasmid primase, P4 family [Oscillospiraceae bacterium]|nr:phage/plasmid primase, P4 family [Oscillospiraceae bacterium]